MQIVLLADIHANLVALQTAITYIQYLKPDKVIVLGDTINRGPRPLECLQIIQYYEQTENWLVLKGNHEEYVIAQSLINDENNYQNSIVHQQTNWTLHQVSNELDYLRNLPNKKILQFGNSSLLFTHASTLGIRTGIYPHTTEADLADLIRLPEPISSNLAVVGVGHTHHPLIRTSNGTTIINAGSVGLPFDGNHNLSIGLLVYHNSYWSSEIVRLSYDLTKAEKDFFLTNYIKDGGPLTELIRLELLYSHSQLSNWTNMYQKLVLDGLLSMEESVNLAKDKFLFYKKIKL